MKIAFVLPMPTLKIVGGYKVVYEYANYFASKGNKVTIFYNSEMGKNSKKIPKLLTYEIRNLITKKEPSWFNLLPNVRKVNLFKLSAKKIKDYDVVFATAAETAPFVNTLNIKKKIYLIQGFEVNWQLDKDALIKTYNYKNMDLVVVSKWLQQKVQEFTNKKVNYIPNGIDEKIFYNFNNQRSSHSLCVLYHLDKCKGWDIAEKVISKLKRIYPDLIVNAFGSPTRPKKWPNWINYVQNANEKEVARLMNNSKVFLCTSRKEGFGLTGLESIFCGCALVTTDCGGIREYADKSNSMICPVDDIQCIVDEVKKVFNNEKIIINKNNLNYFSLLNSEKKMEKLVCGQEE